MEEAYRFDRAMRFKEAVNVQNRLIALVNRESEITSTGYNYQIPKYVKTPFKMTVASAYAFGRGIIKIMLP